MTHFRQAAFTANDAMIVALRYMHVAFWDAESFKPLKVGVAYGINVSGRQISYLESHQHLNAVAEVKSAFYRFISCCR